MKDIELAADLLLQIIKRESDKTGELDVCELLVGMRQFRGEIQLRVDRRRLHGRGPA